MKVIHKANVLTEKQVLENRSNAYDFLDLIGSDKKTKTGI